MNKTDKTLIWKWTLEQIQAVTQRVHAGQDLTPMQWPDGARVAVALSFDFDAETSWLRRGKYSPASMSRGAYGPRVGLPRILKLLSQYDLPATFFVPAIAAQLYPQAIDEILAPGQHEIGIHGWIHELPQELPENEERELLTRSFDFWQERLGKPPAGIRTPAWDFTTYTLDIIRELGFIYDSSLMGDDRPYELVVSEEPSGVVELPVEWLLDDYPYFQIEQARGNYPYIDPDAVLQIWQTEFDVAYQEGTLFQLTMHPQVIGHRARTTILERLICYLKGKSRVWFATHETVARYVGEQASLSQK